MPVNMPEKKILIVDNEPELTDVLKIALETLACFCIQTENDPSHAVAVAKEFAPDLIIMDIKMPGLDGADVAIQLQAETTLSETPIVFLTGTVTTPEIVRHGSKAGGLRFLPKTMRLDSMVAFLKDILRNGAQPVTHPPAENRAA
jgi:two-component system OmpR family response regulator